MATRAEIDAAIDRAATKYGVDPQYLRALAQTESSYRANAKNKSGAAGLFQFMPRTAMSYGLDNPFDVNASAEAAARFTLDNQRFLTKVLGRQPSPQELYLAHQQGAGGARKLLLGNQGAKATSVLGYDKVAQNTPRLKGETDAQFKARINKLTLGDFSGIWDNKFGQNYGNVGVATQLDTTPPPVPRPRDARPQPPASLPFPGQLNLPTSYPSQRLQPVAPVGLSPRLDANGTATFGGLPRDLTAADYGAARASLFNPAPAAFVSPGGVLPGGTLTGQPRTMAPMTLANMPSSYYTGQLAAPNMVRPGIPGAMPAAASNMVRPGIPGRMPIAPPARPVATGQVALPIYRPASPPNSAPPVTRNVTTVTVRPNGSVSGTNAGNTVGSTALPAGYRPVVPTLPSQRTSVYANIPLYAPASPPPARPISQYGNIPVYAPASPPPVSYGFGGTPVGALPAAQKKQAPIPQMRPAVATGLSGGYSTGTASGNYTVKPGETLGQIAARYGVSVQQLAQQSGVSDPNRIAAGAKLVVPTTAKQTTSSSSAGLKPPSSSSASATAARPASSSGTITGSSTGTQYKVGQVYSTASGGKVMAMADGTFKKV